MLRIATLLLDARFREPVEDALVECEVNRPNNAGAYLQTVLGRMRGGQLAGLLDCVCVAARLLRPRAREPTEAP